MLYTQAIFKDPSVRSVSAAPPVSNANMPSSTQPRPSLTQPRPPDLSTGVLFQVRDLRGQHLPLLKQLRAGCLAELRTRYGVSPASLRVYMHYVPQFWWAHVHFTANTALGGHREVGKAILLDDIIDNLV